MASEKQVAANRANADRSTGPKTEAGKAKSRANAWKHGLTAQAITIAGEDPEEFEALRAQLWEEFRPAPGIESVLVDRLAAQAWRLRRMPVFEAALIEVRRVQVVEAEEFNRSINPFAREPEEEEPGSNTGRALIQDARGQDTLGKLSRYEATQLNAFHRTLHELLFLQDRRRHEEERNKTVQVIPVHTSDRDAA